MEKLIEILAILVTRDNLFVLRWSDGCNLFLYGKEVREKGKVVLLSHLEDFLECIIGDENELIWDLCIKFDDK